MKFLYISAEHVSGTLSLFQAEHRRRGDECRFVTFWHSRWNYPDDLCLHLPLMPDRAWVRALRNLMAQARLKSSRSKGVPVWQPGRAERLLFSLRDRVNWLKISKLIEAHRLWDYDVIHLDGGLDFTRDGRFLRRAVERGARIAAFFHGSDLRNRGLIPDYDDLIELRLTSEWDLIETDPRLRYLYLPFDTSEIIPRPYRFHCPIRVFHAARNQYKGTEFVVRAVNSLKTKYKIDLVLARDMPHSEVMKVKAECDILVDQLTNAGGWGYGMSSVEALSMGMPVVTNIPPKMSMRIGEHPFVQADVHSITEVLESLIQDEGRCATLAVRGRQWVEAHHDVRRVGEKLYSYYRELGWIPEV